MENLYIIALIIMTIDYVFCVASYLGRNMPKDLLIRVVWVTISYVFRAFPFLLLAVFHLNFGSSYLSFAFIYVLVSLLATTVQAVSAIVIKIHLEKKTKEKIAHPEKGNEDDK